MSRSAPKQRRSPPSIPFGAGYYFGKRISAAFTDWMMWVFVAMLAIECGVSFWVCWAVLYPFLHWALNQSGIQGTLGKRVVDLAVYNQQGERISPLHSFRYCAAGLFVFMTFGLAYLTIFVRADKRPMHDVLGGVWVASDTKLMKRR